MQPVFPVIASERIARAPEGGHAAISSAGVPLADLRAQTMAAYRALRARTETLVAPLGAEDQTVQSMPDASPTKWHRGHTTWFFEAIVLNPHIAGYTPYDPRYHYLFNSYYEALGTRHPRAERGLLTRPTCEEIAAYRAHVDAAMLTFIERCDETAWRAASPLILLGLNHEEQHQELLLTDILHAFSCNPLLPAYRSDTPAPSAARPLAWIAFPGGTHEIGHGGGAFAFDNESPRHRVLLRPFALASRPVTNSEWLSFIEDGGYTRPEFWLSDGWAAAREGAWTSPLYWRKDGTTWSRFSLHGNQPLDPHAPVANISFYEADAYARWAGKRLPTEAEWETAAATAPRTGNFLESGRLDPAASGQGDGLAQMFGDVWEWTQSPYAPYPGFKPAAGAVAEYNGKFMVNQMVLRGGSCLTPAGHIRPTYRNFFYPPTRWQCAGLRLASDI